MHRYTQPYSRTVVRIIVGQLTEHCKLNGCVPLSHLRTKKMKRGRIYKVHGREKDGSIKYAQNNVNSVIFLIPIQNWSKKMTQLTDAGAIGGLLSLFLLCS